MMQKILLKSTAYLQFLIRHQRGNIVEKYCSEIQNLHLLSLLGSRFCLIVCLYRSIFAYPGSGSNSVRNTQLLNIVNFKFVFDGDF